VSTKLAIAAFIVPYTFALNPVMLFIDVEGPMQVVLIIITALLGIFGVSAALEGFIFTAMNPIQRIPSAAGGLLLIDPNGITDILGILLILAVFVWQVFQKKQRAKAVAA